MPKSYTKKRKGERTSIAIDPNLTDRIDKILKNKEKLSEFAREAISAKIWDREREAITSLTSTQQFHKIESMKKDIDELKKGLDFVSYDLNQWKDVALQMGIAAKKRLKEAKEMVKKIQKK